MRISKSRTMRKDRKEDIQRCLKCKKAECDNCLMYNLSRSGIPRGVKVYNATTGELVGEYESQQLASKAFGVTKGTISQYIKSGLPKRGMLWVRG